MRNRKTVTGTQRRDARVRTTLLEWFRPTLRTDSQGVSLHTGRNLLSATPAANERWERKTFATDFFHKGTTIHSMCFVERQQEARLQLRISAEMGTTSLLGLARDDRGQIEIDTHLLPFRVLGVQLPFIDILTFPQHAHPVQRQLLRTPTSFAVRLRRQGSRGLWISGQGADLSAGGCSFLLAPPYMPNSDTWYDIEMLLTLPRSGEIRPLLNGKVKWVRASHRHIAVGIKVQHPGQRKALAMAVAEIQHALTRRPEDYLL